MPTVKEIVHEIADRLSEEATFDDAMYALYVRQKLEEGLRDLEEDRTHTQADVERRLLDGPPCMKVIWSRRALLDVEHIRE